MKRHDFARELAEIRDADRIDRRLVVIIGASVLTHLGIAAWAWATDVVETESLVASPVAALYRHEMIEVALPDQVEPTTAPGVATPVAPTKAIVPRQTGAARPTAPMTAGDAAQLAAIMTGSDPGRRAPGQLQLPEMGNRRPTIGDDDKGFREQPALHLGAAEPGPLVDDPMLITNAPKATPEPTRGRITIKPLPSDTHGATLTVDMVLAKINTVYMTGLVRCYKKGLLGDATLGGKVALSFTVTERGGLADSHASGVTDEVDGCISTLMQSWRFMIPRDKDGDPTDASFKLGLVLQPS